MIRAFLFISVLWAGIGGASADGGGGTVFAAASLRGALEDIAAGGEDALVLSFGGSGAMARQIAAGAPADLVVLASPDWMDWLVARGTVSPDRVAVIAGNRLVVIGPAGAAPLDGPHDIAARLGTGLLAMGQRDAVPAGTYARQWLTASGQWEALQGRLAETDNVRAALALVARGDTPLGVVYASDAQADPGVTVVYAVPTQAHDPILYPAAALTPAGSAILDRLRGADAQAILTAHGFTPGAP